MKNIIPLSEKALLTLEEASVYFNLGINKLRTMTNDENSPYVLWNGNRRLIKRKAFEECSINKFLTQTYDKINDKFK